MECGEYVIQLNFVIAHIPVGNNTAADYLSRMEIVPKEKLVLKIREDVETRPFEVKVQSAGVAEEWHKCSSPKRTMKQKNKFGNEKNSKTGPKVNEAVIQIDAISENNVDEITYFTQNSRRTNQILLKQPKDAFLLQLKGKVQKKEYSEETLQQDIRYKHYIT